MLCPINLSQKQLNVGVFTEVIHKLISNLFDFTVHLDHELILIFESAMGSNIPATHLRLYAISSFVHGILLLLTSKVKHLFVSEGIAAFRSRELQRHVVYFASDPEVYALKEVIKRLNILLKLPEIFI